MKKTFFAFVLAAICSVSFAQVGQLVGEGRALTRTETAGRCLEYKEASTTDKVVGTAAGGAVGGGLGAAAGKVIGGKSGALVGGLIGAGVGGAAGSSIGGSRTCVLREPQAYEYQVQMKDDSLLKVTQAAYVNLREGGWSYEQKPTKVKVYKFDDGTYSIVRID